MTKKTLKNIGLLGLGLVLSFGITSKIMPEGGMKAFLLAGGKMSGFKADLFDSVDTANDILYQGEPARTVEPTFSFYPENKAVFSGVKNLNGTTYINYYVQETPNNTIEVSVDNITSNPHCPTGWKYKFQGYNRYFKLGEGVSDSSIRSGSAQYPVLETQDGTNKNYQISQDKREVTVFFDKNIKNAQNYNFVLNNAVSVYSDSKKGILIPVSGSFIDGKKLHIKLSAPIDTNYGKIVVNKNTISDIDGRIVKNNIIVGDLIEENGEKVYLIDNKNPQITNILGISGQSTVLNISFSENIFEKSGVNIAKYIKDQNGNAIFDNPNFSELNIEGSELRIFFTKKTEISNLTFNNGIILDKAGNGNGEENNNINSILLPDFNLTSPGNDINIILENLLIQNQNTSQINSNPADAIEAVLSTLLQ